MSEYRVIVRAHSVNPAGVDLLSLECDYPRFILPEVNTHRVMTKNGASSRAIPTARMIDHILGNPARPHTWYSNQPGMQGGAALAPEIAAQCDEIWDDAMMDMISYARLLADLGAHKQHLNRLLEPFMMTKTLLSSTRWKNFFKLRMHPTAQPEFQHLARLISEAIEGSVPVVRSNSFAPDHAWHLPYISDEDRHSACVFMSDERVLLREEFPDLNVTLTEAITRRPSLLVAAYEEVAPIIPLLIKSAARCARTSYKTHDGETPPFEKDVATFLKLYTDPLHATPMEHQARCKHTREVGEFTGNFHGWEQLRKMLPNEAVDEAKEVR